MPLHNAVVRGMVTITEEIESNHRTKLRCTISQLTLSCDVAAVWIPEVQKYYYLAGRLGVEVAGEYYQDKPAIADNRILAICEAHDWAQHLWHGHRLERYTFNPAELRRRILDVIALPIQGVLPNRKRTPEKPFLTLYGLAAVRIVVNGVAYKFPLYPGPYMFEKLWPELGLNVETAIRNRVEENSNGQANAERI
jgi:hypothetical protein